MKSLACNQDSVTALQAKPRTSIHEPPIRLRAPMHEHVANLNHLVKGTVHIVRNRAAESYWVQ
jgi:hypothetical protein